MASSHMVSAEISQHAPLVNLIIPASRKPNGTVGNETVKGLVNGSVSCPRPLKTRFSPTFTPTDSVTHIWTGLGLDIESLGCLNLAPQVEPVLPSSYKMGRE